jgi:hypothetical protein
MTTQPGAPTRQGLHIAQALGLEALLGSSSTWTASQRFNTNVLLTFGTTNGTDADFYYDGTNMQLDVNSGGLILTGAFTASAGGSLTGTWSNLGIVTTVDINGGTVDGAAIGASSHSTIKGTTIDATTDFTVGDTVITNGVITDSSGLSLTAATTVTSTIDIESTGSIGNGRPVNTNEATLIVDRNYSTATSGYSQLRLGGDVTTTSGNGWQSAMATSGYSVTINTGNTHGNVAALELYGPVIHYPDPANGSVTNASTVYIGSAASGASGPNYYALHVAAGTSQFGGQIVADGGMLVNSKIQVDQTELVISSGVVTVTRGYHSLDTEGSASTDDLDTINGGVDGMLLVLRSNNSTRDTTLTESGNIKLVNTDEFTLTDPKDTIMLIYQGGGSYWTELSRSNNQ